MEEVAQKAGLKVCAAFLLQDFDMQGGPYISRAHSLLRIRAGHDGHYTLEVKDCKTMGAATTRIYPANESGERRVSAVGYTKVAHGDIIHFAPRVIGQGGEANYDTMRYRVVFPGLRPPGAWAIKVLVPERDAGLLFGKAGTNIKEAENEAGATIHASLRGHFFPETQERVFALLASSIEALCHATERLLLPLYETTAGSRDVGLSVHLAVPSDPSFLAQLSGMTALRSTKVVVLEGVSCKKREEQVVEVNAPLDGLLSFVRALHERAGGFSYSSLSVEYRNGQPCPGLSSPGTSSGNMGGGLIANAQGKGGGQGAGKYVKGKMQCKKDNRTRVRSGGGISKNRKRRKGGMRDQFKPSNLPPHQRQQKQNRRGY